MKNIIGGSGSSGSTLLRSYLNRHPEIFCGSETGLFNKLDSFKNWEKVRNFYLTDKEDLLRTNGWFPYPSIFLDNEDYGYTRRDVKKILKSNDSIEKFTKIYFDNILNNKSKKIWVEKTPSNAYCFDEFLKKFDDSKVIHIIRNPYDCVASMINRGMSPYFASGVYIMNNLNAMKSMNDHRYLSIRYEDLLKNPDTFFYKVFDHIGASRIPYHELIGFEGEHLQSEEKDSWLNSPKSKINTSKESTFSILDHKKQTAIINSLNMFRPKENIYEVHPLKFICEKYNYEYLAVNKKISCKQNMSIYKSYLYDKIWRLVRGHTREFKFLDKHPKHL